MNHKKSTITVALPTYEAGESLVPTLASIYAQTAIDSIDEILVVVDGNKVSDDIRAKIAHPKLRIWEVPERQGQSARLNDIFSTVTSDLLIVTNDDVILDRHAVEHFKKTHENEKAGLYTCDVQPLPPIGIFQRGLMQSYRLTRALYLNWNDTHNYLACNGRLIALSYPSYKTLTIPTHIWNNDAYIFLTMMRHERLHRHVDNAVVRYKLPSTLKDHIRQSVKFQQSSAELVSSHEEYQKWYKVPSDVMRNALLDELFRHPFDMISFLGISAITRTMRMLTPLKPRAGFWETDVSTKELHVEPLKTHS